VPQGGRDPKARIPPDLGSDRLDEGHEASTLNRMGSLLDAGDVGKRLQHAIEGLDAHFGLAELPTSEAEDDADDVSVLQEPARALDLHLEVVVVGSRPELDFLELDGVLVLPGFFAGLLALVTLLAPVHHAYDRRPGLRGHLHQVEFRLGGPLLGRLEGDDADLLTVLGDQADGADADVFVDSWIVDDSFS